jgi:hypothetical protein
MNYWNRPEEQPDKKISWCMRGDGKIEFQGLNSEELDTLENAMQRGQYWVRVINGRLVKASVHSPLPELTPDGLMTPHFAGERSLDHAGDPDMSRIRNVVDYDTGSLYSASLIIQHITAAINRPRSDRDYAEAAARLESYGFECMRSRRGRNGQFWELWFIPGLWCAQGDLKRAVEPCKESGHATMLKAATRFLCGCPVPFATLDICCQKAAITFD